MRLLTLTLLLCACGGPSLPPPAQPLVRSPYAARPDAPPVHRVEAPTLPTPTRSEIAGGATLLRAARPGLSETRVVLVSRRGDDGAHPRGSVDVAAEVLEEQLEARFPHRDVNGRATHDLLMLRLDVAPEQVPGVLGALAEHVRAPRVSAEELERAREAWLRVLENPSTKTMLLFTALEHLHGGSDELDVHEALHQRLADLSAERVQAILAERLAPSDVALVVVGPHDAGATEDAFRRAFGDWTGGAARRPAQRPALAPPARAALSKPSGASLAEVRYLCRAPGFGARDRAPYELLIEILGGSSLGSRLNQELRTERGLTYAAGAYLDSSWGSDVLIVGAGLASDRVEDALRRFFDQLRSLRRGPIAEAELRTARTRLWARLRHRAEGLALAGLLARGWVHGLDADALGRRYAALAEVDQEALGQVARRRLGPEFGLITLSGDFSQVGGFWVVRDERGLHLERD
ncbi:MAG TPA: insulinase family protein [Polyangiaceae bacterium LLY-WYZ-15_(1-7)]|nr:hypothetical protein [Myxococcales bacterium]MAT23968.1 hypothetical protein [Sandaracinus sp.]HJL05599.1 insulinase family protein [Polyangiaceae bacterium LLY-WYZ-15_(1-7)]MBJ71626.1 hypothetical protein [Sandaracinus sp.]HJL06937.1 insulinase family protein [Polyangiaceae bacterium LLY-WYZ-15_(1-7)]